jgi:hypothetical protein
LSKKKLWAPHSEPCRMPATISPESPSPHVGLDVPSGERATLASVLAKPDDLLYPFAPEFSPNAV